MIEGRLLDLYPENDSMVVWLKTEDGSAVRLADEWVPSIYVDLHHVEAGEVVKSVDGLITGYSFSERFVDPSDRAPSRVLKLEVIARNLKKAAERIELSLPYGSCTLYNVDVSPSQSYLYEQDLFPLAHVKVNEVHAGLGWELVDSAESTSYNISFLKVVRMRVSSEGDNRLGRFSEPIGRIDVDSNGEKLAIDQGSEGDKILSFTEAIKELDPDVVLTEDGDSFTLPYICHRAQQNLLGQLILGRDPIPLRPSVTEGKSYISYGKTMYRAPTTRLHGRVHLDESNTFMLSECNLDGLLEVARTCRIPLHEASRGSIGKLMSSLQFYHAYKRGILVPWRPSNAEHFKSAHDLLVADRGGFIFEPKVGLFENVGEIDFASLFPNIMLKFNISGETVLCDCCPDSPVRVPELNYNVCVRSKGIVPLTLEELLRKRMAYKKLMKEAKDENSKQLYNARQTALKWVLVCAFGYLGFRNAKFGRIDSHIAVCAFARKILLDATRIAERDGFSVLHGIVDSLWLQKDGMNEEDYAQLCKKIEREIGFRISFEGIYAWIAFLPSKVDSSTPVLNRYFGVFRNGEVKLRGVEARRRDTPRIVSLCQFSMLKVLAQGKSASEAKELVPEAIEVLRSYGKAMKSGMVPVSDLLIERQISKSPLAYINRTPQTTASRLLVESGTNLQPGRIVRFLIMDSESGAGIPEELLEEGQGYDVAEYLKSLVASAATILEPFGYNKVRLNNLLIPSA